MYKLFAMSTAAALALTASASAQEADAPQAPREEPAAQAEARPAEPTRRAAPAARPDAGTKTIMHRAAAAGITSMDGGQVDTSVPEEPEVVAMDTSLAQEDALSEARAMFADADTDGDDILTVEEFVAALRPTADAIEADAEPLMAEMTVEQPEAETEAATADAETGEAAGTEVAEAEAPEDEAEPRTEMREVGPSDYLTAKFENISGVDGELSLEELERAEEADFAEADSNGDAVLEGDEVQAYASLKTGRAFY